MIRLLTPASLPIATAIVVVLASLVEPSAAAPAFPVPGPCTGCQASLHPYNESMECEGCTINVWEVTEDFFQNCTSCPPAIDCDTRICTFEFDLYYKTSGDCAGHTWEYDKISPDAEPRNLPPATTATSIHHRGYRDFCGNEDSFEATITNNDSGCPEVLHPTLALGCLACGELVE